MATVENISQSPIALRVKGVYLRVDPGKQLEIDDDEAMKRASMFVEAGELKVVSVDPVVPEPVIENEPVVDSTVVEPEQEAVSEPVETSVEEPAPAQKTKNKKK